MHGQNPKRPPENGDGETLQLQEIFATLQGEGPFVGQPSVFVRLGGCNLACDFCDTEFESFHPIALPQLLAEIDRLSREGSERVRDLIVITGGEPLRQNIAPLCAALLDLGFRVQIETNGTLWRPLPDAVNIVCSPKAPYGPLRPDLLARADALKFIVTAEAGPYHTVPDVGQAGHAVPVYVQPMDVGEVEANRTNMQHALKLAQRHGYRLSLQTHKLLGIA